MAPPKSLIDTWPLAIQKLGWTAVPHILCYAQRELKLKPIEFNVLIHLMTYWRITGPARPKKRTVAEHIGIKERTFQRAVESMERKLGTYREKRGAGKFGSDANIYHLEPLIAALEPLALAELARKSQPRPTRRPFKPISIKGGKTAS